MLPGMHMGPPPVFDCSAVLKKGQFLLVHSIAQCFSHDGCAPFCAGLLWEVQDVSQWQDKLVWGSAQLDRQRSHAIRQQASLLI